MDRVAHPLSRHTGGAALDRCGGPDRASHPGPALDVCAALRRVAGGHGPVGGVCPVPQSGCSGTAGHGSHLTALIDDHLVEMTLSTALAYGSYVGATVLGGSGVLATVFAGLVLGGYGRQIGMSATTRRLLDDPWEYLAFFATAVLFLLIGVTIPGHDLVHAPRLVVVGAAAVIIARIIVLYELGPLVTRHKDRLPLAYRHALFWGSPRGAVAVVATLSLPYRHDIQTLGYGAIVVTLVVQGVTISRVARFLRLESVMPGPGSPSPSPTEDARCVPGGSTFRDATVTSRAGRDTRSRCRPSLPGADPAVGRQHLLHWLLALGSDHGRRRPYGRRGSRHGFCYSSAASAVQLGRGVAPAENARRTRRVGPSTGPT
jgi:hypothetical protein